jgi:prepilin-type N-terminal cleavage/methylation domain-containing protein
VAHRKGFTLTETLIAIVVVSLLVLIGYPKAVNAIATTNVRGARTTVVNMIAKARTVATQTNRRSAQIEFIGNKVLVTAAPRPNPAGGAKDTIGPVRDLNAVYGVTVTVTGLGADSISFDPRGIGTGFGTGEAVISFTKSGKTQKITVNQLGRVIK